jgi:hypothetical protein
VQDRGVTINREKVVSAFERTRRIAVAATFAAAMAAAGIASGQTADGVATMSAGQARQVAIDEIRTLVAVARAGRQHADAQCRAAAARAGDLAGAAIDAVVHADKARERELRAVGAEAVDQPAVQDNYRRVASASREARDSVTKRIANCPELLALR